MRADLSSWLRSTLWGVLLTVWISITLFVVFGPKDPSHGRRLLAWAILLGIGSVAALLLSIVLMGVDLLLLRWRNLPNGRVAFASSAAATLLTAAAYVAYPPSLHPSRTVMVLAALAPMVGAAFVARWIGGTRRSGGRP